MMKLNSKLQAVTYSSMIIASLVLPSVMFAEDATVSSGNTTDVGSTETVRKPPIRDGQGILNRKTEEKRKIKNKSDGTNFCTRIDLGKQRMGEEFGKLNNDLQEKREEQVQKLAEHRTVVDERFDKSREKWESNREQNFEKLMARATTDAQKAAVETFKTTIKNALNTRYSAVDAARTTYRSGVDALRSSRKTALESARTTLKSAIDAAMAKAKSDCAVSGADGAAIKTALQATLKTAQETFKSSTQALEKPNDAIKQLAQTRDELIKKAQEVFKATQQAALSALKSAFPQSETSKTQ